MKSTLGFMTKHSPNIKIFHFHRTGCEVEFFGGTSDPINMTDGVSARVIYY